MSKNGNNVNTDVVHPCVYPVGMLKKPNPLCNVRNFILYPNPLCNVRNFILYHKLSDSVKQKFNYLWINKPFWNGNLCLIIVNTAGRTDWKPISYSVDNLSFVSMARALF